MLTRYARAQFIDPNKVKKNEKMMNDIEIWSKNDCVLFLFWLIRQWAMKNKVFTMMRMKKTRMTTTTTVNMFMSWIVIIVYCYVRQKFYYKVEILLYRINNRFQSNSSIDSFSFHSGCYGCCATLLLRGTSKWSTSRR